MNKKLFSKKIISLGIICPMMIQSLSGCGFANSKSQETVNKSNILVAKSSKQGKVAVKNFAIDEFMKANYAPIDINKLDIPQLDFFDKELDRYDVFLAGEDHYQRVNMPLEIKFLKYFVKKAGVKYYMSEVTCSDAWLYNKYLETGDNTLLKKFAANWDEFSIKDNKTDTYWNEIRNFYLSLDKDKKFKVIGIDVELCLPTAVQVMNLMIANNDIPKSLTLLKELRKNIKEDKFNNFDDNKENVIYGFNLRLQKDIEKRERDYKNFLGKDFVEFKTINEGVISYINACCKGNKKDAEFLNTREKQIIKNFFCMYNTLPKGKFYGQWGAAHTVLQNIDFNNLANNINNSNTKLKNRVYTFNYLYKYLNASMALMYELTNKHSEENENVAFFNFDSKESPFNNIKTKDYIVNVEGIDDKIDINEFFKGWVIIKENKLIKEGMVH